MDKAKITVSKSSPLITKDIEYISTKKGKVSLASQHALCRCGHSHNKPLCDGSHIQNKFDGKCLVPCKSRKHAYMGNKITVFYDSNLCGHIAECVNGLPSVFNPEKIQWIQAKNATPEELIEVIKRCPSGALTYKLENQDEVSNWNSESAISIVEGGPYIVNKIELYDDQHCASTMLSDDHYILCRCGQSKKKPLCDGSHHHISFDDL